MLAVYARPYFSGWLKLSTRRRTTSPASTALLADESKQGRRLADSTVANIVNPLRAALATAKRDGLIRHNPAQGLALPHREQIADEEDEVNVFSHEQLAAVLAMAPERHKPLFELLASSGLRVSEVIALQRLHIQLDGPEPEVWIRRAIVCERIEPPKSRHGRREVRLPPSLAARLRDYLAAQSARDSTTLALPTKLEARSIPTTSAAASSSR